MMPCFGDVSNYIEIGFFYRVFCLSLRRSVSSITSMIGAANTSLQEKMESTSNSNQPTGSINQQTSIPENSISPINEPSRPRHEISTPFFLMFTLLPHTRPRHVDPWRRLPSPHPLPLALRPVSPISPPRFSSSRYTRIIPKATTTHNTLTCLFPVVCSIGSTLNAPGLGLGHRLDVNVDLDLAFTFIRSGYRPDSLDKQET